jgi:hypothetical protein
MSSNHLFAPTCVFAVIVSSSEDTPFVHVLCSTGCTVRYHEKCWKQIRKSTYGDDEVKAGDPCPTPQCDGMLAT